MENKKEKVERKSLEAWARKEFFDDELGRFLKYCNDIQFRTPDEVMSEKEFKNLKACSRY